MKKLLLIFLLCITVNIVKAQSGFEQVVNAGTLGFDNGEISDISTLDDRHTFFVFRDEMNNLYPFVYDSEDDIVIDLGQIQGVGAVFLSNAFMGGQGVDYFPLKVYNDGKLYFTAYSSTDSSTQNYVVEYDLSERGANVYEIDIDYNYTISLEKHEGRVYFALLGSTYQIYELRDNSLNLLLDYPFTRSSAITFMFNGPYPVFNAGKFFIAEKDKILSYDVVSHLIDTLAVFDYSLEESKTEVVYAQSIVHNGFVYFVYKNAKYNTDIFWMTVFDGYVGNAIIIQSDGTKSGTGEIYRYDTGELTGTSNFMLHSGLFTMNQKLYWVGTHNENKKISIYEVKSSVFEYIDTLKIQNSDSKGKPLSYTYSYPMGVLHLNFSLTKINGLEYFLVNALYADSTDMLGEFYWNLWTVKDDKIQYKLQDFPVGGIQHYDKDEIPKIEQTVLSRIVGVRNDSLFSYTFNLISDVGTFFNEDYKIIISAIDLNQKTKSSLDSLTRNNVDFGEILSDMSYNGKGVYFRFYDQEGGANPLKSMWKYDMKFPVSVRNNTVKKELFSIYPNPASKSITIQSSEFLDGQLMIVGVDGKIYQNLRMNGYQQVIDISQLPLGAFVAVFQNESTIESKVLIKSKM